MCIHRLQTPLHGFSSLQPVTFPPPGASLISISVTSVHLPFHSVPSLSTCLSSPTAVKRCRYSLCLSSSTLCNLPPTGVLLYTLTLYCVSFGHPYLQTRWLFSLSEIQIAASSAVLHVHWHSALRHQSCCGLPWLAGHLCNWPTVLELPLPPDGGLIDCHPAPPSFVAIVVEITQVAFLSSHSDCRLFAQNTIWCFPLLSHRLL